MKTLGELIWDENCYFCLIPKCLVLCVIRH